MSGKPFDGTFKDMLELSPEGWAARPVDGRGRGGPGRTVGRVRRVNESWQGRTRGAGVPPNGN